MPELDDVWAVVVNWNGGDDNLHCLASLEAGRFALAYASGVEISTASLRDDLLCVRTQNLRLCVGRRDLLVLDQGDRQVREDLPLM